MAKRPQTIKTLNLFVDGDGYAGALDDVQLPNLVIKTEDYDGAGDVAIALDVGMEKLMLEATINQMEKNLYKLFGKKGVNLTGRAGVSEDGKIIPVIVNMTGTMNEIGGDPLKRNSVVGTKIKIDLDYYALTIDGDQVVEIDVINNIRKIDGVDQLSEARAAAGL
jgi:P2 family phage contractile tail tube protein